jgi:hypothetical protein
MNLSPSPLSHAVLLMTVIRQVFEAGVKPVAPGGAPNFTANAVENLNKMAKCVARI